MRRRERGYGWLHAMFIVLCIVATPFVFTAWLVQRVLDHRAQIAALRAAPQTPALPAYASASPDVEQRLANLEAIVASLDFDLAAKIRETGRSAA
jgi:hypothetical protein